MCSIRAYKTCSTKGFWQNKLKQIEREFTKISDYPKWVFDQLNKKNRLSRNADYENNLTTNKASINTTHKLILLLKVRRTENY